MKKKIFLALLLGLLPLSVNSYEKKDINMFNKLLSNEFNLKIAVKDNNTFEKHKDDLYLTVQNPKFLLEDEKGALEERSISRVGLFHKKLSNLETNELKILAEYLLNNKNYLALDGNVRISITLKDGKNELNGEFVAETQDKQNALFLRKRFLFESSQLAKLEKFEIIEGVSVKHEVRVVSGDKLNITVYIKNIGQKNLEIYSPYTMLDMPPPAPYLWYGVVFQLFSSTNHNANSPNAVISLTKNNIANDDLKPNKDNSALILLPHKERTFEFSVSKKQLNEMLQNLPEEKQFNSRVTLAFPFKINNKDIRVEIATDEQPFPLLQK